MAENKILGILFTMMTTIASIYPPTDFNYDYDITMTWHQLMGARINHSIYFT